MFGAKSREIIRLGQELAETTGERNYHKSIADSKVNEWNARIAYLMSEKDILSAQFQELSQRYTLLDSLLKQLRINVTLPVKVARQGK